MIFNENAAFDGDDPRIPITDYALGLETPMLTAAERRQHFLFAIHAEWVSIEDAERLMRAVMPSGVTTESERTRIICAAKGWLVDTCDDGRCRLDAHTWNDEGTHLGYTGERLAWLCEWVSRWHDRFERDAMTTAGLILWQQYWREQRYDEFLDEADGDLMGGEPPSGNT